MLKKILPPIVLVVALMFSSGVLAAAPPGKGNPQTTCPVMGGSIDKKVFIDYEGKRIYFCCTGCVADFQKDPEKYLKEMEEQGVVLEKSPEAK